MATLDSGAGSQAGGSRKGTVSHGPSTAKELQAHGQQSHGRDRHNGEDSQLIFANLVETGRLGMHSVTAMLCKAAIELLSLCFLQFFRSLCDS